MRTRAAAERIESRYGPRTGNVKMKRIGAVLFGTTALLACASGQGGMESGLPATVEVSNYNRLDVHAYVIASGQRHSLGVVTTNNTESFRLPRIVFSSSRELAFLAMPIGSPRSHTTEGILVEPGDTVLWTITDNLAQSLISVR
jgi:hypothetical protein